jgi:hypothetical protein
LDRARRLSIRFGAKLYYALAIFVLLIMAVLPALHILFFQQAMLLTGVDAIFQTASVKDGHIDPNAPATLVLSLLLMVAWTIFVWRILKRGIGPNVGDLFYLNMLAAFTFAYLDSRLRTYEPFTEAMQRAIGLQTVILFVCFLPRIIASPFMLWANGRLAYLKWKLKRTEKARSTRRGDGDPRQGNGDSGQVPPGS